MFYHQAWRPTRCEDSRHCKSEAGDLRKGWNDQELSGETSQAFKQSSMQCISWFDSWLIGWLIGWPIVGWISSWQVEETQKLTPNYLNSHLYVGPSPFWEQLAKISSFKVGRVDRALVRNLIVGYVTADQAKRPEILRFRKQSLISIACNFPYFSYILSRNKKLISWFF